MNDAVSITRDLVRCPSVTPADAGALGVLERLLKDAGFDVHRVTFGEPGTSRYRQSLRPHRHRGAAHHLCRPHRRGAARRRDRMDASARSPARWKDGFLYGRGAVDMKGGIACSVAAVLQYLADNGGKPKEGSDHRGRGRHFRQRHHQAPEMVRRAQRKVRPLRARRALQCRSARRLHQDRPPRFAIRHAGMSTVYRATSPIRIAHRTRCRIFRD